jgi:hypothetical protein
MSLSSTAPSLTRRNSFAHETIPYCTSSKKPQLSENSLVGVALAKIFVKQLCQICGP